MLIFPETMSEPVDVDTVEEIVISVPPTSPNDPMDEDEEDLVVPHGEEVESDHEAADTATAHLVALDERLARSMALNLRPRR